MIETICRCDRCGKRLEYVSQLDYPVDGAIFMIPSVSVNNKVIKDAKQVVLCAHCIDQLNTEFFNLV